MVYIDYLYNRNGTRKRIRKAVGHSRKMAELALKDIEVRTAKREHLGVHEPQPVRRLFKDYAKEYLEYSKANKARSTWLKEISRVEFFSHWFGDRYLFEISRRQVEQYMEDRLERGGVGAYTVNREVSILKCMLRKAVERGYLNENPLNEIKKLKEPPGRLRYLEPHEIAALLRECSPHLRPIVLTALNAGMRRSEIIHLRWSQVNLRTRNIRIDKSKNNERRVIPINEPLCRELRRLRTGAESEFVFPSERGRPYRDISKGFNRACKRAGITDFRFHDLRHTFASHLVMAGVNLRAVQELMGHKDIKMTMRYSHLSRQHLQEAVGLLGVSISGGADRLMKSVERQAEP